jgi:hypothetical protein
VQRGGEIVLKVLRGSILDLRGSVKPTKQPENFDKVRKAAKKYVAARTAQDD